MSCDLINCIFVFILCLYLFVSFCFGRKKVTSATIYVTSWQLLGCNRLSTPPPPPPDQTFGSGVESFSTHCHCCCCCCRLLSLSLCANKITNGPNMRSIVGLVFVVGAATLYLYLLSTYLPVGPRRVTYSAARDDGVGHPEHSPGPPEDHHR